MGAKDEQQRRPMLTTTPGADDDDDDGGGGGGGDDDDDEHNHTQRGERRDCSGAKALADAVRSTEQKPRSRSFNKML